MSDYKIHNKVVFLTQYHYIFCTKYRRKVLSEIIAQRAKQIIEDVARENNSQIQALEIMPEHVHLLVDLHYRISPHKFIKNVKGRTSNYLRKEFPELVRKIPSLWTKSYFVCSVGNVSQEHIKKYIEDQWKK
jgi:putative transposase